MSTRILFADDSVTAQNMGKRILTEAGYEVVAVSNGAAAVKKIAEQKPDIIILDLYMPGYSGLEVCEKVRGSMATLKTPVLLTVGKMEPYRPEDANRVRADGVIVKPFEASDLLAIVKKFEERIVPPPPPLAQPPAEQEEQEYSEPVAEPAQHSTTPSQPTVEVPDHMASSSAFTDLLSTDGAESVSFNAPPVPAFETAAPARGRVPEYELPVAWRREEDHTKTEIELPAPLASTPEPPQHDVRVVETEIVAQESSNVAPPAPSRPLQIPVYQESAEAAEIHEILPTAATPIGEIEIPREPFLQEGAAEATRNTVADVTDPGLMLTSQPEFSRAELAAAEMAPVDSDFSSVASRETSVALPVLETQEPAAGTSAIHNASFSDAEFEARVAAALEAYGPAENHTQTTKPAPVFDAEPAEHTENFIAEPVIAETPQDRPAPTDQHVSVFDHHPPLAAHVDVSPNVLEAASPAVEHSEEPVTSVSTESQAIESHAVSLSEPLQIEPAPKSEEPAADQKDQLVSGVETATENLAQAAAADGPGDRTTITQAVHRVMERLKPELVDEILRELKPKA